MAALAVGCSNDNSDGTTATGVVTTLNGRVPWADHHGGRLHHR